MTRPELLSNDSRFEAAVQNGVPLCELKKIFKGRFSPGTIQRARVLVLDRMSKNFDKTTEPETPEPMNEDYLLAEVGTPQPIDEYSNTDFRPLYEDVEEEEYKEPRELPDSDTFDPSDPLSDAAPTEEPASAGWLAKINLGPPAPANLFAEAGEVLDMDEEEARYKVGLIRNGLMRLQADIIEFHDRKGWKALGYHSWEDCLKEEFGIQSRQHFSYLQKCGATYHNLLMSGEFDAEDLRRVKDSHLATLSELPAEKQPEALTLALARAETAVYGGLAAITMKGKLTEKIVADVVSEVKAPTNTQIAEKRGATKPGEAASESGGIQSSIDDLLLEGERDQSAQTQEVPAAPGVKITPRAEEETTALPVVPEREPTLLSILRYYSAENLPGYWLLAQDEWGEQYRFYVSTRFAQNLAEGIPDE